ncbi:MAG: MFS transporter, partial [Bacteroidales bacterium]|nr:MFS transporter [Bacteroidales bacterium]
MEKIIKNTQFYKFSAYGFLKNLRFFDAFLILILIDNGLSFTQIGVLYAVREIVINVFEIPSGIIADSLGRKLALVSSFVIFIISFIIFYFASTFWLFFMAFSFYGIADAFRSGTHKGMMMDYLKINSWSHQKITYYGHTRAWSQKGSAISSLIAGVLVYYSGNYQNIFFYSIFPYLLNLLLILSYPKALNHQLKKKDRFKTTTKSLWYTVKQAHVLKLINTSALFSAYLKAVKDYIQPLMVNLALIIPLLTNADIEKKNGLFVGIFYFVLYLINSRASQLAPKLAQISWRDIPFTTLLIGFVFGMSCGLFYVFNLWVLAILFFMGIYVIENLRKPILTGYVSDHVPNEILTSVLSVQSLLKTAM